MDPRRNEPLYPQEPLRFWYVTPLGGHSPELRLDQVGLLAEAIRRNTELRPGRDRVRVGVLGRNPARPLLLDGFFDIVPLDASRPDAHRKSPSGEVVLAEGHEAIRERGIALHRGVKIVLNGVLTRRRPWAPPGPDHIAAVLEEFLRDRVGGAAGAN